MNFSSRFKSHLLTSKNQSFESLALELFRWQAVNNPVYQTYISYLKINPQDVQRIAQIPFLPIEFFKYHKILSGNNVSVEQVFESSGTTGQRRSKHHVADLKWYQQVSEQAFLQHWGPLTNYHIFALLPSYLERNNASLVAMADYFIQQSQSTFSGFYLNDLERLVNQIEEARQSGRRVLLLGVTFALLALADAYTLRWSDVVVMETGGMKGRRKEITRAEVHERLKTKLRISAVASEYGMTELLSQAYSSGEGKFTSPYWMKVLIRDMYDPFDQAQSGRQGGINIIDLTNVDSCAFIETQDLGRMINESQFEVLGRYDNSEARGCNLML